MVTELAPADLLAEFLDIAALRMDPPRTGGGKNLKRRDLAVRQMGREARRGFDAGVVACLPVPVNRTVKKFRQMFVGARFAGLPCVAKF